MSFRNEEKEKLVVLVPVTLVDRVRGERARRSMSECVSEALCNYYGVSPESFGITPSRPLKVKAAAR